MKCVACYCRVSTDEQKKFGFSIQAQKDALEKYKIEVLTIEDDIDKIKEFFKSIGMPVSFKETPVVDLRRIPEMAEKCKESFNVEFYNSKKKCLYDKGYWI